MFIFDLCILSLQLDKHFPIQIKTENQMFKKNQIIFT